MKYIIMKALQDYHKKYSINYTCGKPKILLLLAQTRGREWNAEANQTDGITKGRYQKTAGTEKIADRVAIDVMIRDNTTFKLCTFCSKKGVLMSALFK